MIKGWVTLSSQILRKNFGRLNKWKGVVEAKFEKLYNSNHLYAPFP
jgi:hypothetical protein